METEKEKPKDLIDTSEHKISQSADVLLFRIREEGSDEITGSQDDTTKICYKFSEISVRDKNAPVSMEVESTSKEAESTSADSSQTSLLDSESLKIERLKCLEDLLEKKKLVISLLGRAEEYKKENPARERLDILELNQYKVEYIDGEPVPAKRMEFVITPSRSHLSKRLQTEFIIALIIETKRFEMIIDELCSTFGTKSF